MHYAPVSDAAGGSLALSLRYATDWNLEWRFK